jgi:uncharacterized protein YdeI (YjbR/CyaY-like superfamily)
MSDIYNLHQIPQDLQKILNNNQALLEKWNNLTPLARNEWICWLTIVKKPETRQNHLERLQQEVLEGKKRPCCWPGCPHRRESAKKWFKSKPNI